jgi:hypothetical protein
LFRVQGEIQDDCVQINGTWSCLDDTGNWQQCDLGGGAPPANTTGQLMVAQVAELGWGTAGWQLHMAGRLLAGCTMPPGALRAQPPVKIAKPWR